MYHGYICTQTGVTEHRNQFLHNQKQGGHAVSCNSKIGNMPPPPNHPLIDAQSPMVKELKTKLNRYLVRNALNRDLFDDATQKRSVRFTVKKTFCWFWAFYFQMAIHNGNGRTTQSSDNKIHSINTSAIQRCRWNAAHLPSRWPDSHNLCRSTRRLFNQPAVETSQFINLGLQRTHAGRRGEEERTLEQ